jgi:uncharacterized protein (DUF1501 family)
MDTTEALELCAEQVRAELRAQDDAWGTRGWTRRKFIGGLGLAGVAALGSQLVTTRAAYAATTSPGQRTLVTIFLRGGADGLRVLVPNSSALGLDYLQSVRSGLVPGSSQLIALPGTAGWALNGALKPLYDALWATGELAFVPAVSADGVSRSHFQAQQVLEKGGSTTYTSGWLDRVLSVLGPGTTFRALSEGGAAPGSFEGTQTKLSLHTLADFTFPGWQSILASSEAALNTLYRGMPAPLGLDVPITMSALGTAAAIRASAGGPQNGAVYPAGAFSSALQDLAAVLRAEAGLQVATVDVGGWDTHINEAANADGLLASLAASLAAFMTDLGPARRSRVTVVLMSEFGRRVAQNASGGSDHGHGSLMWVLGGGLAGSNVYGKWNQLSDATLDNGDVPGLNNAFDVLGEVAQKRLGVGDLSTVFPGHTFAPLGLASTV